MKILSAKQIQALDAYTITHEPITHIDLMERAAQVLCKTLLPRFECNGFALFCGPGNNGGDGLALARLLQEAGREVVVVDVLQNGQEGSSSRTENLKRLHAQNIPVVFCDELSAMPKLDQNYVVVDALFGSGLNRPLSELFADMVSALNKLPNKRVAIDIPSGLYADIAPPAPFVALQAEETLSLQFPKRCFFNRFTAPFVGNYQILDIGLHAQAIADTPTNYHLLNKKLVTPLYKARSKFSYKNTFGHALLMAGSAGTFGAALIAGKACLKGGVGLLDMAVPSGYEGRVNIFLPEAMILEDAHTSHLSALPDLSKYQAVGVGPGVGQHSQTKNMLHKLFEQCTRPMVLDADALNMLAADRQLLALLPKECILTPHIGEFKRLVGLENLPHNYLELACAFACEHKCTLVLKDSITAICTAEGDCFFVDAGSPALATAGSGDVLCGLLLALVANGYGAENAAKLGVWLHARAGAIAGSTLGEEGTLAHQISDYFVRAFEELKKE